MFTNEQIFNSKKDFLKSTALTAMPNIVLPSEEADRFLDLVVDQSQFLKNIRIEKMSKNEKTIRSFDFDSTKRIMRPAAGFTSADYIKTFSEGSIVLSSKKMRGCVIVYDSDLEDSIDGSEFANHIMELISKRVSNEISESLFVANETSTGFSATDIRHEFNGLRYDLLSFTRDSGTVPTAAHELDASSTGDFDVAGNVAMMSTGEPWIWEYKFKNMLATLPNKYKGDYSDLRFYTNPAIIADYTETFQTRETELGDKSIIGIAPTTYANIPIISCSQWPITYATGSAGTEEYNEGTADGTYKYGDVVLTNKNNFVLGLHRSLRLEISRSAADEANFTFFSIRMDTMLQNPDAAVILHNVTNG